MPRTSSIFSPLPVGAAQSRATVVSDPVQVANPLSKSPEVSWELSRGRTAGKGYPRGPTYRWIWIALGGIAIVTIIALSAALASCKNSQSLSAVSSVSGGSGGFGVGDINATNASPVALPTMMPSPSSTRAAASLAPATSSAAMSPAAPSPAALTSSAATSSSTLTPAATSPVASSSGTRLPAATSPAAVTPSSAASPSPASATASRTASATAAISPGASASNTASASSSPVPTRIPLSPASVLNLFGLVWFDSPPSNLVDEQAKTGDPAAGTGAAISTFTTPWTSTWDSEYYATGPQKPTIALDLNAIYDVSAFYFVRDWGSFSFSVALASDAGPLDIVPGSQRDVRVAAGGTVSPGQGWANVAFSPPVRARWIIITMTGPSGSSLKEIAAYGIPVGPASGITAMGTRTTPVVPSMTTLIGTNCFIWNNARNLSAVSACREYKDTEWINRVPSQYQWDFFDPDAFNARMVGEGIVHHTCLQGSPNWLVQNTNANFKLIDFATQAIEGATMDPLRWRVAGEMGFQWAARYGRVSVDPSLLRTRVLCQWGVCQVNKTGLGTVSWVEFQNEVDKDWQTRKGYYSPVEYAAALSAFYDGHMGAMGPGYGVRAADPSIKVAMAGLVSIKLDYLTTMWYWFRKYRNGSWPGEALNVHLYCRRPLASGGTIGMAPEECDMKGQLEALCAWRDAFVPAQEVWLSEYGYDTTGGNVWAPSMQGVPVPGGVGTMDISSEEVAGMWMLRSIMAIAAAGNGCVSRAHQYMIDDVNTQSNGQHASSGLLTMYALNGSGQPKAGWWHFAAYTAWLSNYTFIRDVSATLMAGTGAAPPAGFHAFCFARAPNGIPRGGSPPAGATYSLVVWLGTATGASAQVAVPVSASGCPVASAAGSSVQAVLPTTGLSRGAISSLTAAAPMAGGGAATVNVLVREMPTMIMDGSATSHLRNGY